jgi:hypothetical protein
VSEQQPRWGVGSPAEAAERIGRAYPEQPAGQVQQIVKDHARKNGAAVTHGRERRDVKGAEIAESWFVFGAEDDSQADPVLVGDADEPGAWSLGIRIVPPQLEIDLLDLDRYAETVFGKPLQDPGNAPAKDRGGRPAVHDWHRAMRQVLLRVREYGWPATKGELTSELLDWFALHFTEPPDPRTVERFVAAIWPHGPCELRPRDAGDETS